MSWRAYERGPYEVITFARMTCGGASVWLLADVNARQLTAPRIPHSAPALKTPALPSHLFPLSGDYPHACGPSVCHTIDTSAHWWLVHGNDDRLFAASHAVPLDVQRRSQLARIVRGEHADLHQVIIALPFRGRYYPPSPSCRHVDRHAILAVAPRVDARILGPHIVERHVSKRSCSRYCIESGVLPSILRTGRMMTETAVPHHDTCPRNCAVHD